MKIICDTRGWNYPANATANTLIEKIFENGLIPAYLESQFNGLRTTLESGLPTIRNRSGGHGQGSKLVDIPDYLTAYAMHLAATKIVLLVEAYNFSLEIMNLKGRISVQEHQESY